MEKYVRLLLVFALLITSAPSMYAWTMKDDANEILKVNGHMQYRGRYYDLDFNQDSEAGHLNRHNYYGDMSLQFTIEPNEYVSGVFEFNKLIFLGQQYRYNTIQTREEVMPETLVLPDGTTLAVRNTDEAWELHLRKAYMDVKFPGDIPMKLRFGRQGFVLGNGIYTNTNISSVMGYEFSTVGAPEKPAFRFGAMKYYEGLRENYNATATANDVDDVDLFFADLSVPVNKSKVGAFLTHFRDSSKDLDNMLSHINLGLTANLDFGGGWKLKGEFDYQSGKKEMGAGGSDIDWSGSALMLGLSLPPMADNKVNLSFEYGRGSGDDPATTNEFEGYVGVGPFYPYAWAYEYRFLHLTHNASHFFAHHSSGMATNLAPGLENTTYLKGTAMFKLPHKCMFIFSPIYLGLTQQGEAFGWEFDNIFVAPVYKGFSYMFIFAYVAPSNYMKNTKGLNDGAYAFRSQLEFKF